VRLYKKGKVQQRGEVKRNCVGIKAILLKALWNRWGVLGEEKRKGRPGKPSRNPCTSDRKFRRISGGMGNAKRKMPEAPAKNHSRGNA